VSFAALPAEQGGYFVEGGPTFHIVSSERDVVASESSGARNSGILAVGDPDFDGSGARGPTSPVRGRRPKCPAFESLRWARLPQTGLEAAEIVDRWNRFASADEAETLLLGNDASEERLKLLAPGRRVVHVATHGFFVTPDCKSSSPASRGIGGLVVPDDTSSPGTTSGGDSSRAAAVPIEEREDDPLVLSGLVLAGANRRAFAKPGEDDGILTAEEVSAIDLRGVEWVVLSACDTGVGRVLPSEGVFGLRRAFQLAGARTLVMSLWPVEDDAAHLWMTALYDARLARGRTAAEATREASLAVLQACRARGESTSPARWGAFVAAGDFR
jgi:CHAT domain-containing protein